VHAAAVKSFEWLQQDARGSVSGLASALASTLASSPASGSSWFAIGPLKPQPASRTTQARRMEPKLTPCGGGCSVMCRGSRRKTSLTGGATSRHAGRERGRRASRQRGSRRRCGGRAAAIGGERNVLAIWRTSVAPAGAARLRAGRIERPSAALARRAVVASVRRGGHRDASVDLRSQAIHIRTQIVASAYPHAESAPHRSKVAPIAHTLTATYVVLAEPA
jgi:hypothetical protein